MGRGRGEQTIEGGDGARQVLDGDKASDFVRRHFKKRNLANRAGLAPLAGGAVGYLGYEAARWFEPVLDVDKEKPPATDDAVWMFYRNVVAFDRVLQQMKIVSVVFSDAAEGDSSRL